MDYDEINKKVEAETADLPSIIVISHGAKLEIGVCASRGNATLTVSTPDGKPVLMADMGARELLDICKLTCLAAARLIAPERKRPRPKLVS